MAGIQLAYSHRLQTLARELAAQLENRLHDPSALFRPVDIIVPNWNMRTYLEQEVARLLGVTPNLRFRLLRGFLADVLPNQGDWAQTKILGRKQLQHILVDLLEDTEEDTKEIWLDECPEIRDYLDVDNRVARERRLYQLSGELARVFTEYSFSRSAPVFGSELDEEPLLVRWRRLGSDGRTELEGVERWQQILWWQVFGDGGVLEQIEEREETRYMTLADALARVSPDELDRVSPAIHVVGFSYIARLFTEAIGLLGERADVHIHALSPCAQWIEAPPENLDESDEHLLLRQWGSAGADHAGMWKRIAHTVNNVDSTTAKRKNPENLLEALQDNIISGSRRGADKAPPKAADLEAGVRFFECPSIKREVEAVKNEIWTLLRKDSSLRPDDVAVVIAGADRDAYAAQIESVFSGSHYLQHTTVDLPSSSESRILEAAQLLLALPFGKFTRRELLRLMVHPNMRGRGAETDPDEWVRWCEQLGILYAANREEQADTYLAGSFEVGGRTDYEWDLYNWDQGMRRLVLGTFLSGERSGVDNLFAVESRDYEPLEVASGSAPEAARFSALASSIIEDARWLVGKGDEPPRRSAAEWGEIIETYLTTYLTPGAEKADAYKYTACRSIVRQVAEQCPVDSQMSYRMFYEFVHEGLEKLQQTGGNYLTGGVIVSACLPMRAIPFKQIFVVGLGEGQFPNPERQDPLDLRHDNPQQGDLTPADRDRYTFLETLLAAREGITLSWVAREATTGEPLEASSVVNELRWVLEHNFGIPAESQRKLTVRHLLRRFDYQYFPELADAVGQPKSAIPDTEDEDGNELDLNTPSPSVHPKARSEAKLQALRDQLARGDDDRRRSLPSLDGLRRMISSPIGVENDQASFACWNILREELGLPELPSEAGGRETSSADIEVSDPESPPAPPRRIRVTLSQLRAFLESPLQGAAKVQLGLRDDEEDAFAEHRAPVQANKLYQAIHLRELFHRVVRNADYEQDFGALYDEMLLPRVPLRVQFPGGRFLDKNKQAHIATLETWRKNLGFFEIEGKLQRSGIGVEDRTFEKVVPAIELAFEPASDESEARPVIVEITGVTEARTPGGRHHISFVTSEANKPEKRSKYFLRGFISAVASMAAGLQSVDEPAEIIIDSSKTHTGRTNKKNFRKQIGPWAQRFDISPTAYLRNLTHSLLFDSHDYLLPIQFVGEIAENDDKQADRETLHGWLEDELNGYHCNASSQYGPIKDFPRFGAPQDMDIEKTLHARFPHLFAETQ